MNFKAQHRQTMYYSLMGMLLLFAWLMIAYYQAYITLPGASENQITNSFLTIVYSYVLNGKVFTLWCFIMGVQLYVRIENNTRFQVHLIHSLLLLIAAFLLSFFSSVFLILIPLILFRLIIYAVHRISLFALFYLFGIIFLAICWQSFVPQGVLSNDPYFIDLYPIVFRWGFISQLIPLLKSPLSHIQLGYGFSMMIFGFLAGKTKWLMEYHFYYGELKKLFIYSLLLFVLWGLLNFFNVYLLITGWRIGAVFYTLDALSINIISTFMFVFLLIYFENFRWGKRILKMLENAGRRWVVHFFLMVLTLFFVQQGAWQLSLPQAMGFALIIFVILSMGSLHRGNSLQKISAFLQQYF